MLKDTLGPTVSKNILANQKKFERGIVQYIDKNSDILYSLDLTKRISFGDADRDLLYSNIGVSQEQAKAEIAKSKQIPAVNKIKSNTFYCMTILTVGALLEAKKDKLALLTLTYMSLNMYPSIHYGFFKFGANQNVMDYTIANLSNSYRIRTMNSIYALLEDNASVYMNPYKKRLIRCTDDDIAQLVSAMWDRIKGKIKKIAQAYYDNHEKGNYLNYDSDSLEQDNYHIMDNDSYAIDRLATKTYLKMINHQFDSRFIKYAITRSDTSYSKLANIIDDIIGDDENNDVRKVISALIEYYVLTCKKPPDTIGRGEFVSFMKKAYASNAALEQLDFVKSTIDRWLNENMFKYGKAKYANTAKLQYRKSIYMFLVFIINYEAKTQ